MKVHKEKSNKVNMTANCFTNVVSLYPTFKFELKMVIHASLLIKVLILRLVNIFTSTVLM